MMPEKDLARTSKFLSLVLRHQPHMIGLKLDAGGWADVDDLLLRLKQKGIDLDIAGLQYVVDTNNKKRFAFNDDKTKIRASQGHSIEVELGYDKADPPAVLYHGTAEKNCKAILQKGLVKMARQQVHLSADRETAIQVGQRHGKPVVLEVWAKQMAEAGFAFYLSANGVWLTDSVPAAYLRLL